ncbi:MAG: prepilin-type N-terminal cleavage/methylation domain-containing protein [Deltaproteobacteria bacterium]|nr:prepilin-type N-terminal cleavage/methylation domain-containing protein [Deltaproteobacteria bacterium]
MRRGRRGQRGFTLVELMVVVVLVAILALLATPLMRNSRDDRLAFDTARRIEQLWTRAQVRAAGHGAHLFVAEPSGANRGRFILFESFDNSAPPLGPAPRQGCKGVNQWAAVPAWVPGSVSGFIKYIDGFDQNVGGAVADADIRTAFDVGGVGVPAFVMCVSGSTIWMGTGANVAAAITDMTARVLPFSETAQVTVTRNQGGAPIGLQRVVRKTGGASALVFSR